jgi:hypothetical protein
MCRSNGPKTLVSATRIFGYALSALVDGAECRFSSRP